MTLRSETRCQLGSELFKRTREVLALRGCQVEMGKRLLNCFRTEHFDMGVKEIQRAHDSTNKCICSDHCRLCRSASQDIVYSLSLRVARASAIGEDERARSFEA